MVFCTTLTCCVVGVYSAMPENCNPVVVDASTLQIFLICANGGTGGAGVDVACICSINCGWWFV